MKETQKLLWETSMLLGIIGMHMKRGFLGPFVFGKGANFLENQSEKDLDNLTMKLI